MPPTAQEINEHAPGVKINFNMSAFDDESRSPTRAELQLALES